MDILEQCGIVSPQFTKQSGTVIPKGVEDLTEEILQIYRKVRRADGGNEFSDTL